MLEFTLVAIPMIFVMISTFEIARAMWVYGTLSNAVKEGTRFTIVKGSDCAAPPNACSARISDIASRIKAMGSGLLPDQLTLSFTSLSGTTTCRFDQCLTNDSVWPPTGDNAKGQSLSILGKYTFTSAMAMFWPGAGRGYSMPVIYLSATSQEAIQF